MDICEQPGDRPLTIRTLTEIAEREGWSLDARLTFLDSEDECERIVRGARYMPGNFGPEDMRIDLDIEHEDEWEVVDGECCLAPLDLL